MQQGGGIQLSSEGYSYVTEVPSLPSSHHRHHKSSHHHSGSGSNQNRTRRTQRRITHNEKRYHSGRLASPFTYFIECTIKTIVFKQS